MQNPEWLGRHAVDTPLRVAMVVADSDGKPTIVGSDKMNQLPVLALDLESLAFTSVRCIVSVLFWNNKNSIYLSEHLNEQGIVKTLSNRMRYIRICYLLSAMLWEKSWILYHIFLRCFLKLSSLQTSKAPLLSRHLTLNLPGQQL